MLIAILLIAALVLFLLATFGFTRGSISAVHLMAAGLACMTGAELVALL